MSEANPGLALPWARCLGGIWMQRQRGRAKKVFAAGNTGVGFYSFFQYIAGPDIEQVYVIKGGPGTGKSTLMRQIAESVMDRGFSVESHHCASDVGSLDGLVVPLLGVAFIDGMRPHLYDPLYPGAVDHILNLGHYWNSAGIRAHKQAIMAASVEGSRLFQAAYRYLRAAREIHDNWADKIQHMQDWGWVNQQSAQLFKSIMGTKSVADQPGRERHLFASAITPEGPKSYLESLTGPATEIVVIKGQPGSGKSTLLGKIAMAAVERGYNVESYHHPINPDRLQHVLLPELNVFIGTSTELFPYGPDSVSSTINLDYGLSQEKMVRQRVELETDRQTFIQLLNTAVQMIRRAREAHMEVEGYYGANMDFVALDDLRLKLLADILGNGTS